MPAGKRSKSRSTSKGVNALAKTRSSIRSAKASATRSTTRPVKSNSTTPKRGSHPTLKPPCYTVQDDLKIFDAYHAWTGSDSELSQDLAKKLNRPPESIRTRLRDYVKGLNDKEITMLKTHLKKHGPTQPLYARFVYSDELRRNIIYEISTEDPRTKNPRKNAEEYLKKKGTLGRGRSESPELLRKREQKIDDLLTDQSKTQKRINLSRNNQSKPRTYNGKSKKELQKTVEVFLANTHSSFKPRVDENAYILLGILKELAAESKSKLPLKGVLDLMLVKKLTSPGQVQKSLSKSKH